LIHSLVLINLICLLRTIFTYHSEISLMDYFLVYHRAKQRAILSNGNMDHFTFIDRTPFEKVHLIFCKHLLETKRTFSNIGVRAAIKILEMKLHIQSSVKSIGKRKKKPYFIKKLLWSHFWIDFNKFYTKTFGIIYILFVYLLTGRLVSVRVVRGPSCLVPSRMSCISCLFSYIAS
jgi:hypothetical protein